MSDVERCQVSGMARKLMDRGFQHKDQLQMQRFVPASNSQAVHVHITCFSQVGEEERDRS